MVKCGKTEKRVENKKGGDDIVEDYISPFDSPSVVWLKKKAMYYSWQKRHIGTRCLELLRVVDDQDPL